jgi:8-oxo-dGTP pyrophosphatase MutT (NUDIX family)
MPDGGPMGATIVISGRPAIVTYLRPDFRPGTPDDHHSIHVRFLDDGSSLVALRDHDIPAQDEWNEGAHPRGQPKNAGQFAAKGQAIPGAAPAAPKPKKAKAAKPKTPKSAMPTTPKAASPSPPPGFEFSYNSYDGDYKYYKHPSGAIVSISDKGWKLHPNESLEPIAIGTTQESLNKAAAEHVGTPFPGIPLTPPAGFKTEYDGATIKSYKDAAGHVLNILNNGKWTLFPDDDAISGTELAKGTTQQQLEAAVAKNFGNSPSVGGSAIHPAAPAGGQTPPPGFTLVNKGLAENTYEGPNNTKLYLSDDKYWSLTNAKGQTIATGNTPEQLSTAVAKHAAPAAPKTDHATFSFNTPETQHALNEMPSEAQANATALSEAGYTAHPHNLGIDFVKGTHQIELYSDGSFQIGDKDGTPLEHGDKADELPAKLNSILDEFFALEEKPQFKGGAPKAPAATGGMKHGPAPFGGIAPPAAFSAPPEMDDYSATYTDPDGNTLILGKKSGGWGLYKGENKEKVATGYNQQELDDAFEKLHPRGEGGKFVKKNASGELELTDALHPNEKVDDAQFPPAWGIGKYGTMFSWGANPNDPYATVSLGEKENASKWAVWIDGVPVIKGDGAEALEKAIADNISLIQNSKAAQAAAAPAKAPYQGPANVPLATVNAKGEFELPGLTPDGDEPAQLNSAWGMGENGHRFWFGGDDGEKLQASVIIGTGENANKWRVFSRSGGSVQGEGLEGLLAAIQNVAEIPKPGAGGAGGIEHGPAPYPEGTAPPSLFGEPDAGGTGMTSYKGPNHTVIDIYKDGKWYLFGKDGFLDLATGHGQADLDAAVAKHVPELGAAPPAGLAHGEAPYSGDLAPPSDWGKPYAKSGTAWSYQSGTAYLDIYPDGSWALMPETNPIVSGKGQADLDAAILQHVPESIVQGAPEAAAPAPGPTHGPKPFAGSDMQPPIAFNKPGYSSSTMAIFDGPDATHLTLHSTGDWEVSQIKNGANQTIGSGSKQASLDTFAAKMGWLGTPAPAAAPVTQVTPSPSVGSIGAPVTLSGMTKLGENKGSNPGGTYQDAAGKKYYVKLLKTPDHVKNEILAAKLYQLTGAPTLDYHTVADNPNGISTDWQQLDSDNLSGLTPAQREKAKLDFAAHAWLSNWDAVGLTGDNIGALLGSAGGGHINLDVGGSLAYRAQGEPKGAKFGVTVPEWDSLRDPGVNANSAALFGDMTTDQLAQSVKQVAKVTDEQILSAAEEAGYKASELAQMVYKLTSRRDDLIKRAKAEIAGKQLATATAQATAATSGFKPPAGEKWGTPRQTDYSTWDNDYHARLKKAPRATNKEANALNLYTGGDYRPWNKALRDSQGRDAGQFQDYTPYLDRWLDRASFPEDTVLTRIVNTNFAKYLLNEYRSSLKGGKSFGPYQFNDDGFISTDTWSGPLTMKIKIPKGAKAAAVGYHSESPNENEILIARGSRFQIDDVDANGVMHMTLIRSGRAENGVWHPIAGAAPVAAMPVTPKAPTTAATDHLTFAKGSPLPVATLHGKPFESWKPPTDWRYVPGTSSEIAMPSLPQTKKKRSSGIVMLEPDGRVWLVKPTNGFGGYNYTFPKGGVERELDTRANAIKETYEESGLKGKITGFVGDYEGDTSMTRYFLGERETGTPLDHGPESEAVVLVPLAEAGKYLNTDRDKKILADVIASQAAPPLKQAA